MRVLYLINSLGAGGAEQSLAEMLPLLRDKDVELTVACFHRRDEGVQHRVQAAGFDVRFVDATGWVPRVVQVRRLIRQLRPDIVHTTIFEADVVGRLAAAGQGCLVVTSLVNTTYDRTNRRNPNVPAWKLSAVKAIDGWTARHLTHHHHAITYAVRDSMVQNLGIDPMRTTVVLRGRDEARLGAPSDARRQTARARLDIPVDARVIVNVGRQEHQKGQRDLLAAMPRVIGRHPDVVLLVAGRQGNASQELAVLTSELGLSRHVRFLGHREDVSDVLAAADVFAFPSLYEGLGGALIEAMALGLPIVATALPAIREVVEEAVNAQLVPPGDPIQLADGLNRLLGQPALLAAYGRRSREIFEARFTLERSVAGMVSMYGDLLGRGPLTESNL